MKMFKALFIAILAVCFLAGVASAETTLSWTASEGIVEKYTVYVDGAPQDVGMVTEILVSSLTLPSGDADVIFTVTASNIIGESDHSDSVSLGKPTTPGGFRLVSSE